MVNETSRLSRLLNTADAVVIGLGAMIGTGIFVAVGPASASAGPGILIGLCIAAFVAYCNATSSAQLAALYPESGGAYIYGGKRLGPFWGWLAGWGFVVGKLASCAAAALTFGFYLYPPFAKFLALGAVGSLTWVNYRGIQKTAKTTWVTLTLVLVALVITMIASLFGGQAAFKNVLPIMGTGGLRGILRAGAIMFFAFAGYARIATLGEEVENPGHTIPKAIMVALAIALVIYLSVTASVLLAVGSQALGESEAPLVRAVEAGTLAWISPVVRFGATVATLGVLLSLMVGISRTVFSMAANRELPRWFSAVHLRYKVPHHAEIGAGFIIASIVLLGDVRSAIGFSSFTILMYYAITNASAWTLSAEERRWPHGFSVVGLILCLVLATSLPIQSLFWGGAIMVIGGLVMFLKMRNIHDAGA